MGKKFEAYGVVDADLDIGDTACGVYDVINDVVQNTARDEISSTLEEAQKYHDEIRTKDEHHKVIKVTVEEITTLDDAVAYQAGE